MLFIDYVSGVVTCTVPLFVIVLLMHCTDVNTGNLKAEGHRQKTDLYWVPSKTILVK